MKLNILFMCNKPVNLADANTIIDHISAFENYSKHKIWLLSNVGDLPPEINLGRFDAVIIHYSLSLVNDYYISSDSKKRLSEYNGLKILFIQDEYRQINKIISEINFLRIDVLFTCFPPSEMDKIYCKSKLPYLSKYSNLTGYMPERLLSIPFAEKISDRTIDVGYRSRKVPYYLGQLGYEKWNIVELWNQHVNHNEGLRVDISYDENSRIYGEGWIKYLSSCKTVLGVESGASVMDFTGQLQTLIDFHQATYPEDSFLKIQSIYLKEYEGKYMLNQISPRCFEAIALKTVLVLFEGEYSGILVPGKHYITLKKDFSNIQQVLSYIRDEDYLQAMADRAFEEIGLNPQFSYKSFINQVDSSIETEFLLRNKTLVQTPYKEDEFKKLSKSPPVKKHTKYTKYRKYALSIYRGLPWPFRLLLNLILRPRNVFHVLKSIG